MDNYEILKETKVCYEYMRDILENSKVKNNDALILSKAMESLSSIYQNAYDNIRKNPVELKQIQTDLSCPHCSNNVVISDFIDYAYLCEICDENLYLGEGDLNHEWYFKNKQNELKLNKSFTLNVDYDKEQENVWISSESGSGSGAEYNCNSVEELLEAINIYTSNYEIEYYYIKIWKTEENRENGESFKYLYTYANFQDAIDEAKKIINKEDYSFIEVCRNNETIFSSDGINEELYKELEEVNEL